jgi:hypothetical protein
LPIDEPPEERPLPEPSEPIDPPELCGGADDRGAEGWGAGADEDERPDEDDRPDDDELGAGALE